MRKWAQKQTGFTIVELLIVIVIIAILAAITIVAFNGVQARARDSKRASDAKSIVKALEAHRAVYNTFPQETPTAGAGSFEQSTDTPGTFMEYLKGSYFSEVPIDPLNDASHYYRYYVYPVSSLSGYGCPTDKGELMVFYVVGFESGRAPAGDAPLVCSGRTWAGTTSTVYFYYSYEAGK